MINKICENECKGKLGNSTYLIPCVLLRLYTLPNKVIIHLDRCKERYNITGAMRWTARGYA